EGEFTPRENVISTYQDHRMAMAFAPLAVRVPNIAIAEANVVEKSYPGFWADLRQVGLTVNA
ncbi:MAG: 3-phosphoshikimate 1-carboxyvinyltransferase, partial [Bacteroidota bacterium]